ncbi:MAG: ArsR/SmtB family transcription factor [Candidatus Caldatribacteriaceae bacterium]
MVNLAEFFKVLSDETRLRIIALLFQKEMCVCEICDVIGESQPKVSRHLAKLRDANLVRDERQGQWVFYYLNIDDKTATEILSAIISNIEEHPILNEGMKKLNEKSKTM